MEVKIKLDEAERHELRMKIYEKIMLQKEKITQRTLSEKIAGRPQWLYDVLNGKVTMTFPQYMEIVRFVAGDDEEVSDEYI